MKLQYSVLVPRFLLLLVVLAVQHSLAQVADASGSGNGSGDTEDSCRRPVAPSMPSMREEAVRLEIRCHLLCLEEVMENTGTTLQVSRTNPIWPAITKEALRQDPTTYQLVTECRGGCTRMGLNPFQPSVQMCTTECANFCLRTCEESSSCPQLNALCSASVNGSCATGCRLFSGLADLTGPVPIAPPTFPSLIVPTEIHGAGRYRVFPGNTELPDGVAGDSLPITSFLFRILDGNKMFFVWLTSLEDILNLGAFACDEGVIVQYQAVSKYNSLSTLSRSALVSVYGESSMNMPLNPDPHFINVDQQPDGRWGYWKRAEVLVTWERPTGITFLVEYEVSLVNRHFSEIAMCGRTDITIRISRNSTSAVIRAGDTSDGPFSGCSYSVAVMSIPVSGSPIPGHQIPITIATSRTHPVPLNFTCNRSWNDYNGTFRFNISWSMPNFPTLLNSITSFTSQIRLVKPEEAPSSLTGSQIPFQSAILNYSTSLEVRHSSDADAYFSIQLSTTPSSFSMTRLVPDPVHCEYPSLALPPPVPQGVGLDPRGLRYTTARADTCELGVEMRVLWAPPLGRVSGYEVRLVESADETTGEIFATGKVEDTEQTELVLNAVVPADIPVANCLFLQVRSMSPFLSASNWSSPQCVAMASIAVPTAVRIVTDQCRNLTSSSMGDKSKSIVLYLVVGLGSGMLILTSLVLMIMALSCLHHKQKMVAKLESQPSLRKRLPSTSVFPQQLSDASLPLTPLARCPPEDWELHPSQVLVETRLGHGTFGDVFKGMVRGGVGLYKSSGPLCLNGVAIKLLKTTGTANEKEAFLAHIEQAKSISKSVSSHHFVQMIGCVTLYNPLCLVTELPCNGDLLTYLSICRKMIFDAQNGSTAAGNTELQVLDSSPTHQRGGTSQEPEVVVITNAESRTNEREGAGQPADCQVITSGELLSYAAQIAAGMESLSMIGVVHGDVACRNMYLDQNHVIKIADFSLSTGDKSRNGSRIYLNTETGRIPVKWMAPETLSDGAFSIASDVWAFGITLWEIGTLGGLPYNGMRNKDVLSHLQRGYRLKKPGNCSQSLFELMISCWHGDPRNRPSFKALKESIVEMNTTTDASGVTNPVPISTKLDQQSSCYRVFSNYRRKPEEPAESFHVQEAVQSEAVAVELGNGDVGVASEEEGMVDINELSTGKLTGYAYLPIIEEDEAENRADEEEHSTEVIANDHTGSITSSSSSESRASPTHQERTATLEDQDCRSDELHQADSLCTNELSCSSSGVTGSGEHPGFPSSPRSLMKSTTGALIASNEHETSSKTVLSEEAECLVISQGTVCTVDEGIASNTDSLTSVSESSGDCPSIEDGEEETNSKETILPPTSVQGGNQERVHPALF